jgi:hypothetical protein
MNVTDVVSRGSSEEWVASNVMSSYSFKSRTVKIAQMKFGLRRINRKRDVETAHFLLWVQS